MKKALITGITGQDGSYLAELLLEKGYEVHGIIRRASTFNTSRIDHLYSDPHVNGVRLFLHYGDLADSVQMVKLLYELQPDEIYNLGAQSHVRVSFDIPEYTGDVDGLGRPADPRGDPRGGPREEGPLLPGLVLRDVRQGPAGAPDRGDPLLAALPLRLREGLRLLPDGQLPRELQHPREQRHPLQPRVAAPRRDLRHAQDHPGRDPHQGGPPGLALPRQPRRAARLGLREGVRRDDVAHAPAGAGPTTTSSRRTRRTASGSSARRRSASSASTGRSTSSTTPATSARPRSTS